MALWTMAVIKTCIVKKIALAFTIYAGVFLYYGSVYHYFAEETAAGAIFVIPVILFLGHWLCIYFWYVVMKLYAELEGLEIRGGENEIGLQQIHSKH